MKTALRKLAINIVVLVSLSMIFSSLTFADPVSFGNDTVIWLPSDTQSAGCNSPGAGFYYCDNRLNTTAESSVTIDSCSDGAYVEPGSIGDDVEYLVDIFIDDNNGSAANPYPEGSEDLFMRGGDDILVTGTMRCYWDSPDAYFILYKNNTNSTTPWRKIDSGECQGGGVGDMDRTVNTTITLDDIPGNHTIRISMAWDDTPGGTGHLLDIDCACNVLDPDYCDTDDLLIGVEDSMDFHAPDISNINIAPLETGTDDVQLVENLTVTINFTITDKTGVDFVNITLLHEGIYTSLNYTNVSSLYFINITNISDLGYYEIIFWANDTIIKNITTGRKNHVNNYTTAFFYLKNDIYISILSPVFNAIYNTLGVVLDFKINDTLYPFNEVYYDLNGNKTVINESEHVQTVIENSVNYVNNSNQNLSQSFVLSNSINVLDVALFLKRNGDIDSNTTVQLVADSSGPFGAVLEQTKITGFSNSTFSWVNARFNNSVNLSQGTTYWIKILNENSSSNVLFAYNTTYSNGVFYSNNSLDLVMKIYSLFDYNTTITADIGTNTLYVCENNSNNDVGCSFSQFKVDLTPPTFGAPSYSDPLELGSTQTIELFIYDNISLIQNAFLEFNNSNTSMSKLYNIAGGSRFRGTIAGLGVGNYNFSIYGNNSVGWINKSSLYTFNVSDTTKPNVSSIIYAPTDSQVVDPNITIYFNFALSDQSSIASATLQYRDNQTSTWTNANTSLISGTNYTANFTPPTEDIYYYRVNSQDIYGNELNSTEQSIEIYYERTWGITNNNYLLSSIPNQGDTINPINFTIINSGDVPIEFNLTKANGMSSHFSVTYNNNSFILENGTNISIEMFVADVAMVIGSAYQSNGLVSCIGFNCNPLDQTITGQSVVEGSGPLLSMVLAYITSTGGTTVAPIHPLKYSTRSESILHKFRATITNIGYLEANNITFWFNFTNTSLWIKNFTDTGNLSANFSLGKNVQANNTIDFEIEFYIKASANLSRLYDINITSELTFNGSNRTYFFSTKVNVTKDQPPTPENCTNGIDDDGDSLIDGDDLECKDYEAPGGRGSSSPPPPSGGKGSTPISSGLGLGTTISYNLTVGYPKNVDILRGQTKTINVTITNYFKNKYFADIKVDVEGYFENQINFSPELINELNFNETKTITISFNAPYYIGYSINDIILVFDYLLINTGQNKSQGKNETTKADFRLIINEVDSEDAITCLEKSAQIVRNTSTLNISIDYLNDKLKRQSQALSTMDFTLAQQLCFEIESDFEKILNLKTRIYNLKDSIELRNKEGYNMDDIIILFNLTIDLFNDGEFDILENSLKDVESSFALQITIENSNLFNRFGKFIRNNFKEILVFLFIFIILSDFVYKDIKKIVVKNKVKNLVEQKKEIHDKFTELQDRYYVRKEISREYFQIHYKKHNEKIAKLNEDTVNYENTLEKLGKKVEISASIEEKESKIKEKIIELQKSYYVRHNIDKKTFENMNESFKKILAKLRKERFVAKTSKKHIFIETLKKNFEKIKPLFYKWNSEQSKKK